MSQVSFLARGQRHVIDRLRRRHPLPLTAFPLRFAVRWCSATRKDQGNGILTDDKAPVQSMPADARTYWQSILDTIESPVAQRMIEQLDMENVTGLPDVLPKRPNCLDFHREVKAQHPDKLVLIQVGDFYETMGHDAVLLVNGCGLAPMLPKNGIPLAGFPIANLPKMRKMIVEQLRLSMVVCNQYDLAKDERHGSYTKGRRVSAIYHPGDQSYAVALDNPSPSAVTSTVCLSWEREGFSIAEFRTDRAKVRIASGMTQDAMWGQLASRSVAAPICIHTSFAERVPDWQKRLKRVMPHVANRIWKFEAEDPAAAFLQFLEQHQKTKTELTIDRLSHQKSKRQRCPSFYTASQLGMAGGNGIPDILSFIVPPDSLSPVKEWFRDLLLVPRGQETSCIIQKALRCIAGISDSLPPMRTYLSPGGVAKARTYFSKQQMLIEML